MPETPEALRGTEFTEWSDADLVASLSMFYDACGFNNGDMHNGFMSGVEAVLGTTADVETEDLSEEQLAEREKVLGEVRRRVAAKFSLSGGTDG